MKECNMNPFLNWINNLLADPLPFEAPVPTTQTVGKQRPDLGPKQLQWCRDNLGIFQSCEAQVIASRVTTASQSDGE